MKGVGVEKATVLFLAMVASVLACHRIVLVMAKERLMGGSNATT